MYQLTQGYQKGYLRNIALLSTSKDEIRINFVNILGAVFKLNKADAGQQNGIVSLVEQVKI